MNVFERDTNVTFGHVLTPIDENSLSSRPKLSFSKMSSTDESEVIYTLACECESLLEEIIAAVATCKKPTATILFTEYQQRFAVWTSYQGVFASKSQCLDRRLRNLPDIHDLVLRYLDFLRRTLTECMLL